MDMVADRLERLERQFRRWKWVGIAFAILIASPILFAFIGLLMWDGSHEAERHLIRDKERRVRRDIGTDPDGTPRLLFIGEGGKVRLIAHIGTGDTPNPSFADKEGQTRLLPGMHEDGPRFPTERDERCARERQGERP
jgi:hypothetical protein